MSREADAPEANPELIPCWNGDMSVAKEMAAACAEADIDARLARGPCCGKGGCGCAPKMLLLVAQADIPRVAQLMTEMQRSQWAIMMEREGLDLADFPVEQGITTGGAEASGPSPFHPCPACGTAAPLVDGACSDCGLQLA